MKAGKVQSHETGISWGIVFALAIVVCTGLSGCGIGGKTRPVSGRVTFNGKVVESGTITFVPLDGTKGPSAGAVISDGKYDVPQGHGVLAGGRYRVEIESLVKSNRKGHNPFKPDGAPAQLYDNIIPPKYNAESELTVMIADEQTAPVFDFDLTTDKKDKRRAN
jgi:hypothetical protein